MAPKQQPPPIHGGDHVPDGPDPIPGLETGGEYGFGYELRRELIEAADFANANNDNGTVTFDSTYYRGFHATLIGSNGGASYFALRLGPKGAMYHLQFICQRGPDCGKFRFEWAQVPGTQHDGDFFPASPPASFGSGATVLPFDGLIYEPDDTTTIAGGLDWVVFGTGDEQDLYNSTVVKNDIGNTSPNSRYQQFRIMGDPGDVLSADVSSGGMTTYGSDGGPGIYMLRAISRGKNGLSSGYNVRLSSLVVTREFYDNYSV